MSRLRLHDIPADRPFLDLLAQAWLARPAMTPLDHARGTILLPTRRAARGLGEAFLRATDGRPMLLPRIAAVGAVDEAPLLLTGSASLPPPAMSPAQRLAALARLILPLEGALGLGGGLDSVWRLARDLAQLMDEAERAEVPLDRALNQAVPADLAAHWQKTLTFLTIATAAWPAVLAESGLMDPVSRQSALLQAQAEAWEATPPADPVWLAGIAGGLPAVARLARTVAALPQGAVILPGLDREMSAESWEALNASHPQFRLAGLLATLGATRDDVTPFAPEAAPVAPSGRFRLLSQALLPAAALGQWRAAEAASLAEGIAGITRLRAADQQQEAVAIALILRDALETPGKRAVLVTPDRVLAARVAAELGRFGVLADDSAGEPLTETPPGTLLRLLATAVAEGLAPVPLLSLLKHPMTALGLTPGECRAAARALERDCLRGPRPAAGLTGLRLALDATKHPSDSSRDLLVRLEDALAPLLRFTGYTAAAPHDLLASLIQSAELLTKPEGGETPLWAAEEGEALSALLAECLPALATLPDTDPGRLPGLLEALMEGTVVRSRRALRPEAGEVAATLHPRLFIWGLLEARLQTADLVVLGGLVETVWPPATDPGPWLSRRMREAAGLPSPEEAIGEAAQDFVSAACAAPQLVLSTPRRLAGAPAVPTRWLTRLETLLGSRGIALPEHPAPLWAEALDQPEGAPQPVRPPAPRPPLALRPRRLSVTEIETWLADPYALYARRILRLRELDPLDQATDAADYGSLVHHGLQLFLAEAGTAWTAASPAQLRIAMERALGEARLRPALARWWRPRLRRIADWIAVEEARRRPDLALEALASEVKGVWTFATEAGPFTLSGRADRIERRRDGRLGIIDYKTGTTPTASQVEQGHRPQLTLEAAMAARGAFGEALTGAPGELTYWRLQGGADPGGAVTVAAAEAAALHTLAETAMAELHDLVTRFDDPERPYLAQPHPGRAARESLYGQLARMGEWAGNGEEDEA